MNGPLLDYLPHGHKQRYIGYYSIKQCCIWYTCRYIGLKSRFETDDHLVKNVVMLITVFPYAI